MMYRLVGNEFGLPRGMARALDLCSEQCPNGLIVPDGTLRGPCQQSANQSRSNSAGLVVGSARCGFRRASTCLDSVFNKMLSPC